MADAPHRIVRGWLESLSSGVIELDRDWTASRPPRFTLGRHCPTPAGLQPAPALAVGRTFGYFLAPGGRITFLLPLEHGCGIDPSRDQVYLAGDVNGWQDAVGEAAWRLRPERVDGEPVLAWTGEAARFFATPGGQFKFVTGEHQWLTPPPDASNAVTDGHGNRNRVLDPHRTGRHLWRFTVSGVLDLAEAWMATWADRAGSEKVLVEPGRFFHQLRTDLELGAVVRPGSTLFRLFAPRARSVTLHVQANGDDAPVDTFALVRREDGDGAAGVWEVTLDQNLHGWRYWYRVAGEPSQGFDPERRILDPYALAALGREGPGLVIDQAWIGPGDRSFRTPAWHDLVIAEAHVRDLVAHAPVAATPEERRGFSGLRKWVESPQFHLHLLGVNAVELQPLHEFDNVTDEEYHWGYMTNNFFAPESSYALVPERGSGIRELQQLVAAFHRRGMAVLVDVVFNHVGVPAHLQFLDRRYYFEQDAQGQATNWSGCGNDLRAGSAMVRRLIIDSCRHYLEAFGVDGFRFDLAELLGVDVLREVEAALKRVKPDVILIAEPWSYRGHIAGALRDTGWASWNDGYRDFVREYVCGRGTAERMEYFLRGSPWYFAKWPAQTVNYTESHDDRTWIDQITENPDGNGYAPTSNDRRRTHLMAALLFLSVGIPMLSAGQDFLRSKHGVGNTYLRGDLNALDYRRLYRHLSTHTYFADWIAFRRGRLGRLLRHYTRPSEGFFRFLPGGDGRAFAVLLNADRSQGPARLLFAVNPTLSDQGVRVGDEVAAAAWDQLADQDRFYLSGRPGPAMPVEAELWLPPLGCSLWVSDPGEAG